MQTSDAICRRSCLCANAAPQYRHVMSCASFAAVTSSSNSKSAGIILCAEQKSAGMQTLQFLAVPKHTMAAAHWWEGPAVPYGLVVLCNQIGTAL